MAKYSCASGEFSDVGTLIEPASGHFYLRLLFNYTSLIHISLPVPIHTFSIFVVLQNATRKQFECINEETAELRCVYSVSTRSRAGCVGARDTNARILIGCWSGILRTSAVSVYFSVISISLQIDLLRIFEWIIAEWRITSIKCKFGGF